LQFLLELKDLKIVKQSPQSFPAFSLLIGFFGLFHKVNLMYSFTLTMLKNYWASTVNGQPLLTRAGKPSPTLLPERERARTLVPLLPNGGYLGIE
jgi:hypothetical protein